MARGHGRRYVSDDAALLEFCARLKLEACPHCRQVGTLIRHGYLRGYAERGSEHEVRGRRFFCSNRHQRPGCGRTFSVLLGAVLANFVVQTGTLSSFAERVLGGESRAAAWRTASALSVSSGYRLWRRFACAQSALRARLSRVSAPPASTRREPLGGLLEHFRAVFPSAACPFSASQVYFGLGLFD